MEQLKENIDSVNIEITETMLEDINQVHFSQPNPAP
jgi:aryl-alcohol dehydrogenase-like predicted oxidoreductase